jgi:EAL domain-containing protein (putative c-di-GMP-specific phosphodiesterase class I)
MQVVFEGIDTPAQRDVALAAGADLVQGFCFAPPLSASAAEAFVAEYRQLGNRDMAVPRARG